MMKFKTKDWKGTEKYRQHITIKPTNDSFCNTHKQSVPYITYKADIDTCNWKIKIEWD